MQKWWRKIGLAMGMLFLVVNIVVFYQTWHIIHFCRPENKLFVPPDKMGFAAKLKTLFAGMYNPKSMDDSIPKLAYQTIDLSTSDGHKLEAWHIPAPENKGTVVILHGFKGCKANMLPVAWYFHQQGMNCFMLDFSGHGNSDGNSSSLGYCEAKEVEIAYQYVKTHNPAPVMLFGSSMGAVAAMRAVSIYGIQPDKMILEAPFGSMLQATCNRFDMQGVPPFPLAQLMVFWGGVQEGYWGFSNCPIEYAKTVKVPVLLLYGLNDRKVSLQETTAIFANLQGEKALHLFKHSGHGTLLTTEPDEWRSTVGNFLGTTVIAQCQ